MISSRIKRNDKKEDLEKFHNLTGDTFEIENDFIDQNWENLENEQKSQEVGYFLDKTWKWSRLPSRHLSYNFKFNFIYFNLIHFLI